MSTETSDKFCSETRYNGQVKWFNNKAGYGFITMTDGTESHDIFVHHSSLSVSNEQYKYLVQGEYVEFNIARITTENATHEWQATDVTGFNRGFLMCETRYNSRSIRRPHERTGDADTTEFTNRTHTTHQPRRRFNHTQQGSVTGVAPVVTQDNREYSRGRRGNNIPVRFYGQGPRGGNGEQWLLVRSSDAPPTTTYHRHGYTHTQDQPHHYNRRRQTTHAHSSTH